MNLPECDWQAITGGFRCRYCNTIRKRAIRRRCTKAPDRLRLGSAIKAGLDALGVTQDRVAALVESIGLPPSCGGCAKRQEQLDEFDRKVEAWLSKAANWFRSQS